MPGTPSSPLASLEQSEAWQQHRRQLDEAWAKADTAIVKRLQARKLPVLLCGMLAPPNYGQDYARQFNAIYPELAQQYGVPLYPFFLDGVATVEKLNQPDGLHPTAEGVDVIVSRILPAVEAFVRSIGGQRS